MAIIIGGSGSTGSSLLCQILNRHTELYCGPETSLFCKGKVYHEWNKAKSKLLENGIKGLRNSGWHIYNTTNLTQATLGLTQKKIEALADRSTSFQEFCNQYFSYILENQNKKNWIEKTPANAFHFKDFLHTFPNGKVIHMIRNPYDTIASLMDRGFDVFYSVSLYLMNVSAALGCKNDDRYFEIRYEDLVEDPKTSITQLCNFLELNFEEKMLSANNSNGEKITKLKGWNYDETAKIEKGSVGRFEHATNHVQDQIITTVQSIYLCKKFTVHYNIDHRDILDLLDDLNYPLVNMGKAREPGLKLLKIKDQLRRIRRLSPIQWYNYPIGIR